MLLLNVGSNYSTESNQNASHLIIIAISAGSRRIKPHAMLTRPTFFYISKMDFGIFVYFLLTNIPQNYWKILHTVLGINIVFSIGKEVSNWYNTNSFQCRQRFSCLSNLFI